MNDDVRPALCRRGIQGFCPALQMKCIPTFCQLSAAGALTQVKIVFSYLLVMNASRSWFPLFEFQDWQYQSYLILPKSEEKEAPPASVVTAKKWAKGSFNCGQAFKEGDEGYTLGGKLVFREGVELEVDARGLKGVGDQPGTFEAAGYGTQGPTKGALYKLSGWVFPRLPMPTTGASRPLIIKGAVWAVNGPDSNPAIELGGSPNGTVGIFEIVSIGDA